MKVFSLLDNTGEDLDLNPVEYRHAGTYTCVIRGLSEKGPVKMKMTFHISVIGKTGMLMCHSVLKLSEKHLISYKAAGSTLSSLYTHQKLECAVHVENEPIRSQYSKSMQLMMVLAPPTVYR